MSVTLLDTAGASVTGEWVNLSAVGRTPERPPTIYVWGTFDGNTVTIEVQPDASEDVTPGGDDVFTPADGTFTEAGAKTMTLSAHRVRLTTSADGSPELYGVIM